MVYLDSCPCGVGEEVRKKGNLRQCRRLIDKESLPRGFLIAFGEALLRYARNYGEQKIPSLFLQG